MFAFSPQQARRVCTKDLLVLVKMHTHCAAQLQTRVVHLRYIHASDQVEEHANPAAPALLFAAELQQQ